MLQKTILGDERSRIKMRNPNQRKGLAERNTMLLNIERVGSLNPLKDVLPR
jgi:hypothetical protein